MTRFWPAGLAAIAIAIRQRRRDRQALEDLTSTCGEHKTGKCPKLRRSATLRADKAAGRQSIRLRGPALEPGSYVARIVAASQGLRSEPRTVKFRVRG